MNREKVIKGLNSCARTDGKYCGHCPYTNEGDCVAMMSQDAIALLKEQEAVKPNHNPFSPTDWFCGKCGMCISRFHDYCPSCGQAVKWE